MRRISTILHKKGLYLLSLIVLLISHSYAQTYLPSPAVMSNANTSGEYYNDVSITLAPGFSASGANGGFHAFIMSDNVPLNANVSSTKNFIVTSTPKIAGILTATQLAGRKTSELIQTVQYLDGTGRSIQTVQIKGSPSNRDIVQPIAYDALGRQPVQYLGYTVDPTLSDGSYKANALQSGSGQSQFYSSPPSGVLTNQYPSSSTAYETSSLGRVVEQGAPGLAWQLSSSGLTGAGQTKRLSYGTNDASSLNAGSGYWAKQYGVVFTADNVPSLVDQGTYVANKLFVGLTKNEDWKSSDGKAGTTESYKDQTGRLILERKFNQKNVNGVATIEVLSTYYVYDDLGNLSFVLTPGALADNGLPSQTTLDNLCYQYQFDARNRQIARKIPGKAGWDQVVYNMNNQVVFMRDPVETVNGQWLFAKYDAFGRVIMTGIVNDNSTQQSLQVSVNSQTSSLWEEPSGDIYGYTSRSLPITNTGNANIIPLTINYYDDYSFPGLPTPYNYSGSTKTKGLITASKTAILNNPQNMLWTVYYYDDRGRVKAQFKQHDLGGGSPNTANFDLVTNTYNFNDALTSSIRQHFNTTSSSPIVTILDSCLYDHAGRPKQAYEQFNGGANVLIAQVDYNELGQVITKHLHKEPGSSVFLQDLNFTYNERGWLRTLSTSSNIFGLDLRYNSPDAGISQLFGGGVSEMLYSGTNAGSKAFSYSYDKLDRVTSAGSTGGVLNETLSYDLMGNITHLTRSGNSNADLSYSYYNNNLSNQVQTIQNSGASFRSYSYDSNGNANSDGTTKAITYNLLDLPLAVAQNGTTLATYSYDASGNKLRNTGSDGTWDYIDGIVYHNNAIAFIQTQEGRALPNGSNYMYQYDLTDHMGNVRVTFDKNPSTQQARVLQEDEYYTFGLRKQPGVYDFSNGNLYLYNGKELQRDLTTQYDFGVRFYDPVIARWNVIDPMSGSYSSVSPYNYVHNNPLKISDTNGAFDDYYYYYGSESAGYVVQNNAPDRYYQADAGGYFNQIGYNDLSAGMSSSYALVSQALQNGFAQFDNGVYSNNYNSSSSLYGGQYDDQINSVVNSSVRQNYESGLKLGDYNQYTGFVKGSGEAGTPAFDPIDFAAGGIVGGLEGLAGAGIRSAEITATEAGGSALKGGGYAYRYMTEGELKAIQETGLLRGGREGETFFTKDLYSSASKVENRLALPSTPTLRVEFEILNNPTLLRNGTKVTPANGFIGQGSEFLTLDPVKVKLINWQPLSH